MYYETFKKVCERKGTTVTTVLKKIGRSSGLTGRWKEGSSPTLEIAEEMARCLGVTIDELATGHAPVNAVLSDNEKEWLDIIHQIPDSKQEICKDFLRTHMVKPEMYEDGRKRTVS